MLRAASVGSKGRKMLGIYCFRYSMQRFENYRANIVEVMQSYTRHTKDVSTARWRNNFLDIYSIIRERCSPVPRRQPWWAWKLRPTACCNTPCAILRFSTPIVFLVCKSIDCVERLASRSRCNCHDVVAPRSEQLQGFVIEIYDICRWLFSKPQF